MTTIDRYLAALLLAGLCSTPVVVRADPLPRFVPAQVPFNATLSNATPLRFGMTAQDAALMLGTPLDYISGKPGDEIYRTIRSVGGSGLFPRTDKLFLQFRRGRLTGWKADWGRDWMWRSAARNETRP